MSGPLAQRPYAGVKVAVLGASGFIGRWVARALTRASADLQLVVRTSSETEGMFDRYEIRGEVHEVNLLDADATRTLLRRLAPAVTFNLAGYGVDPDERSDANPRVAELLNEGLPGLIAETMAERPAPGWDGRRIVHAGSVYEYGNIGGHLEESATPAPFGLYGRSKLAGTRALARVCEARGVTGLTARICQIYGPGEHRGRLLPLLFEARRTGALPSLSIGTQRKDFTYVEDVAEGLLRLGVSNGPPGEIVNLATGRLTTVRDFVVQAARVLHVEPELLRFEKPLSDNELQHREVAVDRLRALTDWVPATAVADGVQQTRFFLDRARIE